MSLPSLFSSRSVSRSHNNEEACVRVSAVVWPTASSASASTAPPPPEAPLMLREPLPSPAESAPFPVLWGDWPRCPIRRRWFQLLRSQTVILPSERIHPEKKQDSIVPERQTRAQRAHWRLSWDERLARNTCPSTDTFLKVTIHGLPATFATLFGLDVVTTAYTLWNTVCFFFLGTVLLDTSSIFTSIYTSLFHTTVGVNVSATAN